MKRTPSSSLINHYILLYIKPCPLTIFSAAFFPSIKPFGMTLGVRISYLWRNSWKRIRFGKPSLQILIPSSTPLHLNWSRTRGATILPAYNYKITKLYIHVHVHVHVCMHCVYIGMYVLCVCRYVCMYICMYVHMYVCMYIVCMYVHVCMYVRTCRYMYICTCMYVCMYVCMYACMYVCMYTHVHVCTYVHTCNYMYM